MTNYEKIINKLSESEDKLKHFMLIINEYGLCEFCIYDYPKCQSSIEPETDLYDYCSNGILKFLRSEENK